MKILVLGGDGYVGWPLSVRLALLHPQATIVLADNQARRAQVSECGGNSVTPIEDPIERVVAFQRVFGKTNLRYVNLDVTTPALDALIAELRPDVVYHLAQQCSAPYSMMDAEHAMFTVHNNEVGNMRVLWALRNLVPEAHLVKLGTFGEYAKGGIDIAEGYFEPTYKGRTADRPMPYPRQSDDIYHTSKINDTNYISLACRAWGLRVTDVMQSTIFGVWTEETYAHPQLYTRFDYDAVWGTVVNRFVAQTILGVPMTVYGTGLQRTGLMGLEDAVASLAAMATQTPAAGQHRVINHVTERDPCILDIAEIVSRAAETHGFHAQIDRGGYNPRSENDTEKAAYRVENHYVASCVSHTPFEKVLAPMFGTITTFKDRIRPEVFPPRVRWER